LNVQCNIYSVRKYLYLAGVHSISENITPNINIPFKLS